MRRKGVTSIALAKLVGVSSATISRTFTANARISTVLPSGLRPLLLPRSKVTRRTSRLNPLDSDCLYSFS